MMPISYSIDEQQQVVTSIWSGEVTAEMLRDHWTKLLADPQARAIGRSLADLREAAITFTGDELAALVRVVVQPKLDGLVWKAAIVVSRPDQFGVSRQFDVFSQDHSRNQIFHDPAKALAWLQEP